VLVDLHHERDGDTSEAFAHNPDGRPRLDSTVSCMSAFVAPLCPVAAIPSNPGLSLLGHIWATLGSQRARNSAK
jgi:hypothetical protein